MAPLILLELRFAKWAIESGLQHEDLLKAALEIETGLVDARLGGFLVKKRIASKTKGKRGGFRTILAHRQGDRLIFLYGFSKSESENISRKEHLALSKLADIYMKYDRQYLATLIRQELLLEIQSNEPDPQNRS